MANFSMSANSVDRAVTTAGKLQQLTAGEAVSQFDYLYTDTDNTVKKAINDTQAESTVTHMAMAGAASGTVVTCLIVEAGVKITTTGLVAETMYVVSATAGLSAPAADLIATDHMFAIGSAHSTTELTFHPQYNGVIA